MKTWKVQSRMKIKKAWKLAEMRNVGSMGERAGKLSQGSEVG